MIKRIYYIDVKYISFCEVKYGYDKTLDRPNILYEDAIQGE